MDEQSSAPQQGASVRFITWFVERVILPLLPLGVVRFVDWLMRFQSNGFRDEKILIYAFLLPIIYLREVENFAAKALLAISASIGLVLLVVAYIARNEAHPGTPERAYGIGFWFCVSYILLASVYELYKIFRRDRRVE